MESDWSWVSHDGCIKKKVISVGNRRVHPFINSKCRVKFFDVTVDNDNAVYGCPQCDVERDLVMGETETLFDRSLEKLLATMVSSEVSFCEIKLKDTLCSFKIELITFSQLPSKPLYRMNEEEKLMAAENIKGKASELIKNNRFEDATALLHRALKCVCWAGGNIEDNNFSDLYFSILANLSLCSLKLNNSEKTVTLCNRLLKYRPNHVKCLLRRATALDFLQEAERAKQDVLSALAIEPNNKTAEQLLDKIKAHLSKQKMEYSVLVKKMLQIDKK